MKLKDLLKIYNFRECYELDGENIDDTQVVRIYISKDDYFEIGVYDFGRKNCLTKVLNQDVLNADVALINVIRETLTIHLGVLTE